MEFCPECGAILLPMNKKLKCKCGYEKSLSDEVKDQYEVKGETNPKAEIIVTDNKDNNAHKYGVFFNITSINDEVISGSVNL